MIKKIAINKIIVSSLCLLLFLLFYFFPTHETIKEKKNIKVKENNQVVYLIDQDNYLAKVNVYFDSNTIEDEIKKKLNILIKGYNELNNFYPVLPSNTKINNIKVDKDNVYIDFSKEFSLVDNLLRDNMIEGIVYTITEINGINNVFIYSNNKEIKGINNPLTRSYGINKEYNINSLNNINKTTVFFSKDNYYVPVTKINNREDEKIEIIIDELKSSVNSQNNLNSGLTDKIKLVDYKINNDSVNLTFNEDIYNKDRELISKSIFENYNIDKVIFNNTYVVNK